MWTMMHPLFQLFKVSSRKFDESIERYYSNLPLLSPPHLSAFFNHSKRINHPSRVARITLVPCRNFVAVLPSGRRYQTDTVSVGSANKEKRLGKAEKDDIHLCIILISRFVHESKTASFTIPSFSLYSTSYIPYSIFSFIPTNYIQYSVLHFLSFYSNDFTSFHIEKQTRNGNRDEKFFPAMIRVITKKERKKRTYIA